MSDTPKRRWTDKWVAPSIKFSFVAMTLIFFLILLMFGNIVHRIQHNGHHIDELVQANSDRIHDIQQSRVDSCKRTYEGIREVFKPFYPPKPRTLKQIQDLETFNTTINKLKAHCIVQTHPGG